MSSQVWTPETELLANTCESEVLSACITAGIPPDRAALGMVRKCESVIRKMADSVEDVVVGMQFIELADDLDMGARVMASKIGGGN